LTIDDGLAYLRAATAIRPHSAILRGLIALLLIERKQYQQAVRELDGAIALGPELATLYSLKAIATAMLGNDKEAEKALRTTLEALSKLVLQPLLPHAAIELSRGLAYPIFLAVMVVASGIVLKEEVRRFEHGGGSWF
jgi:tetratricopeptide (TPR) repeat protein